MGRVGRREEKGREENRKQGLGCFLVLGWLRLWLGCDWVVEVGRCWIDTVSLYWCVGFEFLSI